MVLIGHYPIMTLVTAVLTATAYLEIKDISIVQVQGISL